MVVRRSVGVLGFGHANAGLAAYFAQGGIEIAAWALPDHPGALRKVRENGGTFAVYGDTINGDVRITEASSLEQLVRSEKFLILGTRADVQERYVAELEKLNDLLGDSILFVMTGVGFTMVYSDRLKFKYILESNTAPLASKLDSDRDKCAVNLKDMKAEFELSCFPLCYRNPEDPKAAEADFPDEVNRLLKDYFRAKIQPRVPIHIAMACTNSILHGPTAVLNIGRLPDEYNQLTNVAREYINSRSIPPRGFFYGNYMNTYVHRSQQAIDLERLKITSKCGLLEVCDLLDDANKDYGTKFQNMREYSAAPFRHNVQKATPEDMQHRYYREEYLGFTLFSAIARIVNEPAIGFSAFATIMELCAPTPFEKCGRDLQGFTCADLVRFGLSFREKH